MSGRGLAGRRAFAGRRRQSAKKEKPDGSRYVPGAVVRARLRPNWEQAAKLPAMAEDAELLPEVKAACRERDLHVYHTGVALGSDPGWPDLTIVGPGGLLVRELKGSDGRVTVVQLEWVEWLRAGGVDAGFWWPEDWLLCDIDRELDAIIRPRPGVVALPALGAVPLPREPVRAPRGAVRLGPAVREPGVTYRFCGCELDRDHRPDCPRGYGRVPGSR